VIALPWHTLKGPGHELKLPLQDGCDKLNTSQPSLLSRTITLNILPGENLGSALPLNESISQNQKGKQMHKG